MVLGRGVAIFNVSEAGGEGGSVSSNEYGEKNARFDPGWPLESRSIDLENNKKRASEIKRRIKEENFSHS